MTRRKKSRGVFSALDPSPRSRRRKKGKGLAGVQIRAGDVSRRGRKRKDLASYLGFDSASMRRDRRSSLGAKAVRAAADRLRPSERLAIDDAIRDAEQNDPVVSAAQRDATRVDPSKQNVIQRLIATVRNRLSAYERNE